MSIGSKILNQHFHLLFLGSKDLGRTLALRASTHFVTTCLESVQQLETWLINQAEVDLVVVEWEESFKDALVDFLELLPEATPVVWSDRGELDTKKALTQGAVAVMGSRYLQGDLLVEKLLEVQKFYRLQRKYQQVKGELVQLQMVERERQERMERQRQALFSFARSKLRDKDLETVVHRLAEVCQEMIGADRVSIWLSMKEPQVLRFQTLAGEDGQLGEKSQLCLEQQKDYAQELERGQPLAMSSLKNLSLYEPQWPLLLKGPNTALIDAPIFFNGALKGLLRVEDACVPREWEQEELGFVDSICDLVSLALENEERFNVVREMRVKEQLYLAKLEKSNAELQEFASVVSHDLQEPLYKVKAFGEVLAKRHKTNLDEEGHFLIDRMQKATVRMSFLIDDLLKYSRVSSKGRLFEKVELSGIVREVLNDLEYRILEAKAEIVLEALPSIEADPMQMRQLFQNLLSNALKFRKKEAPLHIAIRLLSESSTEVVLQIEDNGIGFDPQYAEMIFGVFQRLHSADEVSGTGIGLAIVRKIVLRHHGKIKAEGVPQRGAKFTVTLPRYQENILPQNEVAPFGRKESLGKSITSFI